MDCRKPATNHLGGLALFTSALCWFLLRGITRAARPTGTTSNHARRIAADYFCATMQAESNQIPPIASAVLRTGNNAAGVTAETVRLLRAKTSVQTRLQVLAKQAG